MSNQINPSECEQKAQVEYYKNLYYIFFAISIILTYTGIICTVAMNNNSNNQYIVSTDSNFNDFTIEECSFVFIEKPKCSEEHNYKSQTNNDNFFSFASSIVSLLGISNVVISSLIVNKAKYKYGYIIYDLLKENFNFSEISILIYFLILCCNIYAIEYKYKISSVIFLLALISMLIAFIIIYYICSLSKNAIQILIKLDLDKKISLATKCNSLSNYKTITDTCHKIIKYMTSFKDGISEKEWIFASDCLFKIVQIVPDGSQNDDHYKSLKDFLKVESRYEYRTKDSAIMFYKVFASLYSNLTVPTQTLNIDKLNCVHEFFDQIYKNCSIHDNQKQMIYIAIALWLFFDVEDQEALNMLNDLMRNKNTSITNFKNKDVATIYLCYLYAHVFFFASNAVYYDDTRFEYIYSRVNTSKAVINNLFSILKQDKKYFTNILFLFKIRLVSCSTLDDRYIYSSFFPTLHSRVFLNSRQVKKNIKSYDLIDEICSYFHIY